MVLFIHRTFSGIILLLAILIITHDPVSAWGFYGHRKINAMAVFALPAPLFGFYKQNYDHVVALAVNPDKRRYAVEGEAECHYIDLDHYGSSPADSVIRNWTEACNVFGEDELRAHGIVPYKINWVYHSLLKAFVNNDIKKIIRLSADLGHYIADAHVPLHCTSNYNGQKTGQYGIHGLWESRIPELFAGSYTNLVDEVEYISEVDQVVWQTVFDSYELVDKVLYLERMVDASVIPSMKMEHEIRNERVVRTFSAHYASEYHEALDGMVERRWRKSIHTISSFWYSAWVDAGQPDLTPQEFEPGLSDTVITVAPEMMGKQLHGHTD